MSSLGSVADAATAAAARRSALSAVDPRSADSAASALSGVVPMPNSAIAARAIVPCGAERDTARDAGDGEVTTPACELLHRETAARLPHRVPDRGQDLVDLDSGGPHRLEEVPRRDGPYAGPPGHLHLGVECHGHRRKFRCRIGVHGGPADGAAVPDLEVPDVRHRPMQQGRARGNVVAVFRLGLTYHGTDAQRAVLALDAAQRGDTVEVDEVLEAREAKRQQRNEALPTGKNFCLVAEFGEHGRRFRDGRRPVEAKGRRLHDPSAEATCSAQAFSAASWSAAARASPA